MIGENIKKLRKLANLTQTQLGNLLDYDQSTIAKIENNERTLNISKAKELCAILGCSLNDLVTGNTENRLKISYRNLNLTKEAFQDIAKLNRIALNLKEMKAMNGSSRG